ncbi:hypothetical protein [Streptomyces sp. NPDC002520]
MTNGTAHPEPKKRAHGMTMRVYTVDRYGTITRDRGTVTVAFGNQPLPQLPMMSTAYPPCECGRCRAGQAVTR